MSNLYGPPEMESPRLLLLTANETAALELRAQFYSNDEAGTLLGTSGGAVAHRLITAMRRNNLESTRELLQAFVREKKSTP